MMRFFLIVILGGVSAFAQQYTISTIAGGQPTRTSVVATNISIDRPASVTVDATGNLYFTALDSVFRLDPGGTMTRVAGSERRGSSGDGGPAAAAQLNQPSGLATDSEGNLFIADTVNCRIRKVTPGGIIVTVAGNGTVGYIGGTGDGGPATSAALYKPSAVAVDLQGNIFIAEPYTGSAAEPYIAQPNSGRVRKINRGGIISTVAGGGSGDLGDDGPATSARLRYPTGVALDGRGNLFIAQQGSSDNATGVFGGGVRKVSADGIIRTVRDSGPDARTVVLDGGGNLFIADGAGGVIRRISSSGVLSTVAGKGAYLGTQGGYSGDGGPAIEAELSLPNGVTVDHQGNIFIADTYNLRIRRVSPDGIIRTVAGDGSYPHSGDGGPAADAKLYQPFGVAVDGKGNVFVADTANNRIRRISPDGVMSTVAGNGAYPLPFSGDGGPATSAPLSGPQGVATDAQGNVFVSDSSHRRVRKITPAGIINTVAGASGPNLYPRGIAADGQGNVLVADQANSQILKISPGGFISTVAGDGTAGYSQDGGRAIGSRLYGPQGVAADGQGNIFIADTGTSRIRKVSPDGIISTVAGGVLNDPSRQIFPPAGVAVDSQGNLFIAEAASNRIRIVTADGSISTIAGNGFPRYDGDGGPAASAALNYPNSVAVDSQGNVFVADTFNSAIRVLRPTNQRVIVSAVVDAASEKSVPVSPGKIVVIYGTGLGPSKLVQNAPVSGVFSAQAGGTIVSFNGAPAPVIYASATQVAAIAPYSLAGTSAQITVSWQGESSVAVTVPVAARAPSLFTSNQTGAGQAAAVNVADGSVNDAAHPVAIGAYIALFATGEGQTTPPGKDGQIASGAVLPQPNLKVNATVGGVPAEVAYAGAAPDLVAGLMQVNVRIPPGIQPGGYVPVTIQVGDAATVPGAVWIAVAGNQ